MTAAEVKTIVIIMASMIVLIGSFIPEGMVISYGGFNKAPTALKIYVILHLGVIVSGVLYISWLRPPEIYLGL